MGLTASAILVEVNISVWPANKLDKGATEMLINDNSAVQNSAQVRKNLMAGTSLRKKIADYAAACRLWHNNATLPWATKGPRLLATSMFMDYKSELNVRRDTFNKMAQEFYFEYPSLKLTAQSSLGALANPEDYPTLEEVQTRFAFRTVFSPIPESGDFRLDAAAQDLKELREQYEADFNSRLATAVRKP